MFDDIAYKIAAGAAVIGACAMAGRSLARVDRRRAKLLAETMDGMQLLRIHMLEDLMPLEAALTRSEAFILAQTGLCMDGRSASEAWHDVSCRETARGGGLDSLSHEDCEVMDRFFMRLGDSSRDEQKQVFDCAIRELGELESAARGDGMQKNRLYTALGALAGAAAVVGLV